MLTGCLILCAVHAWAQDAVTVQASKPQAVQWRATIEVAASVAAAQSASLAAERAGQVVAVLFSSGQSVPAGAPLVRLDSAPEAAQLALDNAKLKEAEATLARETRLMSIAGASQAALEQAQADEAEAKAQVDYDQAMLAQLTITAPFSGTLGIRTISTGDYIASGQVVARLTQAAPLRVLFSVPQTQAGGIAVGEPFSLQAPDAATPDGGLTGRITALAPLLDTATNARDAEGVITGDAGALLPGMSGTVTLATGAPQPAFALPATALNDSPLGPFVYVLDPAGPDYKLRAVYVTKLGDAGGQTYVGAAGLQPSTLVLTLGGFKFADGDSVKLQAP